MTEVVTLGRTVIYSLVDPRSGQTRYVGKTARGMLARLISHKHAAKRGQLPVNRWVMKLIRETGSGPIFNWIESVPDGADWAARERFWIAEMRKRGADLLNLTEGGEGLAGHVFSQEHRAKISSGLRKGEMFTCACGCEFWRKPGEIAKGNARFCSKACYQKSQIGISKPMPPAATERGVQAAAAKKLAQDDCKRGHPLSGENLFITSNGARGCKECRKEHNHAYLARIKG